MAFGASAPNVGQVVYRKDLLSNASVCSNCGYHHRIDSTERIAVLVDSNSFVAMDQELLPMDPLGFKDRRAYADRLRETQASTGLRDGVVITGSVRLRASLWLLP
jgi:acetyl-CoA carboxylase carboxyl transferase subunit beta